MNTSTGWFKAGDYDNQWSFREYNNEQHFYENRVWVRKHPWSKCWEHTNRKQLEWTPLPHANNVEEAKAAALAIWRMS